MSIDISEKLLSEIQKWIHWHHSGYQFKIDSQAWENILHKSFLACDLNSTWNAGSHSQGVIKLSIVQSLFLCVGSSLAEYKSILNPVLSFSFPFFSLQSPQLKIAYGSV